LEDKYFRDENCSLGQQFWRSNLKKQIDDEGHARFSGLERSCLGDQSLIVAYKHKT
jgi:hypothetical protein